MTPTDGELMGRVAVGDRGAFGTLYDRLAARVFGLLLRLLRNHGDAEDVLQETFLRVWELALICLAPMTLGCNSPDATAGSYPGKKISSSQLQLEKHKFCVFLEDEMSAG